MHWACSAAPGGSEPREPLALTSACLLMPARSLSLQRASAKQAAVLSETMRHLFQCSAYLGADPSDEGRAREVVEVIDSARDAIRQGGQSVAAGAWRAA